MKKFEPGDRVILNAGKEFEVVAIAGAGFPKTIVPARSETGRSDGRTPDQVRKEFGHRLKASVKRGRKAAKRLKDAAAGGFENRPPRGMFQS